jgi:hypothetical protein
MKNIFLITALLSLAVGRLNSQVPPTFVPGQTWTNDFVYVPLDKNTNLASHYTAGFISTNIGYLIPYNTRFSLQGCTVASPSVTYWSGELLLTTNGVITGSGTTITYGSGSNSSVISGFTVSSNSMVKTPVLKETYTSNGQVTYSADCILNLVSSSTTFLAKGRLVDGYAVNYPSTNSNSLSKFYGYYTNLVIATNILIDENPFTGLPETNYHGYYPYFTGSNTIITNVILNALYTDYPLPKYSPQFYTNYVELELQTNVVVVNGVTNFTVSNSLITHTLFSLPYSLQPVPKVLNLTIFSPAKSFLGNLTATPF